MADTKASGEPAASALNGIDFWAGVQGGADVQISVTQVMSAVLALLGDSDGTLAADSDLVFATQKATKTFVTNLTGALAPLASPALSGTPTAPTVGSSGDSTTKIATTAFVQAVVTAALASEMVYKGTIDCSVNPNYPAATAGWLYIVSVSGLIGGRAGAAVGAGDVIICKTTNAGGTQLSVGADWDIVHSSFTVFTGGTMASAINEAPPAGLASASTVNIGAAGANTINISGTTTITAFDSIAAGAMRRLVFAGILTIAYNAATLVLPTAANITTAAGDVAEFESLGSGNWRCTSYTRANGTALSSVGAFTGGTLTSALNEAPPVTIASSTTPAIFAAAGNTINLTGTTTVTGFDTIAAGAVRRVVFGGILQLTYNATSMQNLTAANITTAAGDIAEFESLGSGNTKMLAYTRANGTPLVGTFTGGTLTSALNEAPAVTLASATTTNIGAAGANSVTVTGTTAITAFDAIAAGAKRELTFSGILTLTNNGVSLILPGGANITTAAGDVADFVSLGSGNWRCTAYTRANGQAVAGSFTGGTLTSALNEAPTVTIASGSTVNIGAAAGNTVSITGTTTITAFDTIAAGAFRRTIFAGILILTYNATSMQLLSAANITTAAGDVAEWISLGAGNWEMTAYSKASGQALVGGAGGSGAMGAGVNAQTGTSYAVVTGDAGKLVTLSNAAAIAVSIPQAGSAGFASTWSTVLRCINDGVVTITPATSTIDGAATLVLRRGDAVFICSDGTNYQVVLIRAQSRGESALTDAVSGTVAIDASLADNFYLLGTSSANTRKFGNPTHPVAGQVINVRFKQSSAGTNAITWDTKYKAASGISLIAASTAANAEDFWSAQYSLTDDTWFVTYNQAYS